LALFLLGRFTASAACGATASSCSGLGSLATAAFLFRDVLEVVLVAAGSGCCVVALLVDDEVELVGKFEVPAESLAAERVTLDDISTAFLMV
jgi:hypothetical protein